MAAPSDAPGVSLASLRDVRPDELENTLGEEIAAWREELSWDFTPSADLVRRFVGMQALNGHALRVGQEAAGYCYFVFDEHKGLIGDLYVRRRFGAPQHERMLVEAAVAEMMSSPFLRRIEAQLLMLRSPFQGGWPEPNYLRIFERNFMLADLSAAASLPPGRATQYIEILDWSDGIEEEAARLIALAYEGHIDAEINDQYRSVAGARKFLNNIIQYPGCGSFFPAASFLAFERGVGRLIGVCLTSLVAQDAGHITQVCVAPDWVGCGAGYELMRRALQSLVARGCRRASLTVTASNERAVRLYERLGFRTLRRFAAHVWDGF